MNQFKGAAFGDNFQGADGQGATQMLGKLFPDNGRKSSKEEYEKMQACAQMLERYVERIMKEGGNMKLDPQDMERWKNDYFKTLVESGPELIDSQFYTGGRANSILGIGNDGGFSVEELFQFLYRLYKAMAHYKVPSADVNSIVQNIDLFGCAEILEKYVSRFPKTKGCVKFEEEDAKVWKERYFPNLVEGGPKLIDYAFFNPSNKNYGIGLDCNFHARELFQFLYRLYKEIAKKLG